LPRGLQYHRFRLFGPIFGFCNLSQSGYAS
jgi:hypothetical protein